MLTTGRFCARFAKATMLAGVSTLAFTAPTLAQENARQQSFSAPEEIIVTARKRDESLMRTPVVVQAVSASQIEDLHITNIYAISAAAPGLQLNSAFGSVGASVYLRGLGNGQAANFIDQSVQLNIDGIGVSNGTFFRGGLFDMAQIEVMKGPQALFFGKSTSAGIIAIHSADPTAEWDTKVSVGYEFNADEMDLNGYVSGPLTDTLGVRIAGYRNTTKGWFYNPNPASTARRVPDGEDYGGRLTLKYDNPDHGLRVKFKVSADRTSSNFPSGSTIQDICTNGVSSVPTYNSFSSSCTLDKFTNGHPDSPPFVPGLVFGPFDPTPFATGWPSRLYRDGKPYQYTNTVLSVLTVDYDITDGLTVSSVTGYSATKVGESMSSQLPGIGTFGLAVRSVMQEYSQELRLTSDWKDSWINFMLGGLINPSVRKDNLNLPIPSFGFYTDNTTRLKTSNKSVFGQVLLTPIEHWELSAGVRFTHVDKRFKSAIASSNVAPGGFEQIQNIPEANRHFAEDATTPEFTLTYRPTDALTAFVSYKEGYKGPGFNMSLTEVAYTGTSGSPFGGERVKGVEGGVKASLLDRSLALTLTGYRYNYRGLQVAIPNVTSVVIRPDADARVQGAELGADYRVPSVAGLTLSAFVNYNDAHFTRFTSAPCWGGQIASQGCVGGFQNLNGRQLAFAAKWVGRIGFDYETELNDTYMVGLNMSSQFSGGYNAVPEQNPNGRQKSYALLDATLRFGKIDETWDIALIGRNLTDKLYFTGGQDRGTVTPGIAANAGMNVSRPRQIMLQFTVHPNRL